MTRRAADRVLRWLALSIVVGVVIVLAAAIVVSEHRGLLLGIGAVYLVVSTVAYLGLRRSLERAFAEQARSDPGN